MYISADRSQLSDVYYIVSQIVAFSYVVIDILHYCFKIGLRVMRRKIAYGFNCWMNIWYSQVDRISMGQFKLLRDNYGGYEMNLNLDCVSIVHLRSNRTSKHQILRLDLTSASKIRY